MVNNISMKNNINFEIEDSPGFSKKLSLNTKELDFFKSAITKQWLKTISKFSNESYEILLEKKLEIKDYHKISKNIDHANLWRKESRILPKEFYQKFKKSFFFSELKSFFGEISISDEENLGYGNIYWRLVRPNEFSDIGPIHRDSWFWELNKNFPRPNFPFQRIKVWIAIETEAGKNGLLVEKNSHKRKDINWKGKFKHGIMKPLLIDEEESFDMTLIETLPGESIIFNDNLLHGGALNLGTNTRISTEFTILKKINIK